MWRPFKGAVTGAAFSPEGKRIASPSTDKTARVWDAESGSELARVARDKWIAGVAFSPDGGRIATATRDGTARVGDRQRPRTDPGRPRILGGRGSRSAPAGRVIASVVNRFPGGSLRLPFAMRSAALRPLARGPAVTTFASVGGAYRTRRDLRPEQEGAAGRDVHPDGGRVATASGDKTARVWDVRALLLVARSP